MQKGFAVLKLDVNGGETTLIARTSATFYSVEEAQNVVKQTTETLSQKGYNYGSGKIGTQYPNSEAGPLTSL